MFNVPVLEAMACARPVLLSDIPQHQELVRLSKAGTIFSIEDDNSIVKGINEIFLKKTLFSSNARKFAESLDWSKIADRVSAIYKEIGIK
jgi:glycosyltransferase involved in cell wall biosynthesis